MWLTLICFLVSVANALLLSNALGLPARELEGNQNPQLPYKMLRIDYNDHYSHLKEGYMLQLVLYYKNANGIVPEWHCPTRTLAGGRETPWRKCRQMGVQINLISLCSAWLSLGEGVLIRLNAHCCHFRRSLSSAIILRSLMGGIFAQQSKKEDSRPSSTEARFVTTRIASLICSILSIYA